jgi:hypothetical protein
VTTGDELITAQRTASRVASCAHLADVRLFRSQAEVRSFPPSNATLTYSLAINPSVDFAEGDAYCVVTVEYATNIFDVSDEAEQGLDEDELDPSDALFVLSFRYSALYELSEHSHGGLTLDEVRAFAETTGVMAIYPYAREYVADVTRRAGFPTLTLKTFRLPSPWTSIKDEDPTFQSDDKVQISGSSDA